MAIEAIKNQQTVTQIASEYGVYPTQASQWKKQVVEELPQLFTNGRSKAAPDNEQLVAELYRQIGQLKVELDWLQKNATPPLNRIDSLLKRRAVHRRLSDNANCWVCASFYYRPVGESPHNLLYMRLIDEQYT